MFTNWLFGRENYLSRKRVLAGGGQGGGWGMMRNLNFLSLGKSSALFSRKEKRDRFTSESEIMP